MIPLNIPKEDFPAWRAAFDAAEENDEDLTTDSGLNTGDPVNPPPPPTPPA